jgi:hypothetical protein
MKKKQTKLIGLKKSRRRAVRGYTDLHFRPASGAPSHKRFCRIVKINSRILVAAFEYYADEILFLLFFQSIYSNLQKGFFARGNKLDSTT